MYLITVVYIGYISQLIGKREEKISLAEGSSVGDLVRLLAEKYGEAFTSTVLSSDCAIDSWTRLLINDKDIRTMEGLNTRLEDGVEVCVMALYEVPAGG